MKVALAINSIIGPETKGGPGDEGYQLALGLLQRNALGKVFCFGVTDNLEIPPELVEPFCGNPIKKRLIGIISRLHRRYPGIRIRRRIEQWMDSSFAKMIKEDAGDILYCPKPLYPELMSRAGKLGIKTIVETSVLHPRFNLDVVCGERKRLGVSGTSGYTDRVRVANIERALYRADLVFAWSGFIRDSYIRYGVPAEKVICGEAFEPPGVDVEKFHPVDTREIMPFTVLHVSSITVIKGVQYLLDAWRKVVDRIDGRLVLVGPVDSDMKSVITRCNSRNVNWVGHTDNPADYYQDSSVFVSPSVSDAGPRTVLESMACGVPAIVSSHCGISEIIKTGDNGMVYEWNNVDELAELLVKCYEDQKALREMGDRARKTVLAYSVGNYTADVWNRIGTVMDTLVDKS